MRAAAPFLPEQPATTRGYYATSMDRIGLALGLGGVCGAAGTVALLTASGARDPGTLVAGALLGTFAAMTGIVVLLGPVWALLHRAHRRGPIVAALACAGVVGLMLLVLRVPLVSSGAVTMLLAAAVTGIAMQWVAYRRIL